MIEQFVVRQAELDIVLEVLRGNIDSPSCQHALLVAPRGQGKTMLLARVAAELRTDENLSTNLFAVRFMEESLEVFTLADFWLETLFHLARETEPHDPELSRELRQAYDGLADRYDATLLEHQAFATVMDAADRLNRKLVLMVENLQGLFRNVDDDFGWKLRKVLQCEPQIILLGTATSRFAALDDATQPFFEFFRMVVLEPLDTMACRRLWEMIGGKPITQREIRPLEILTGGNPRLLVIVGMFARHRSFHQLMEALVGLIDGYTEYFRGHLDVLAKTECRVYLAVIDLWQPSTAAEIAARARMDIRPVSTLLGRLKERRVINIDNSGPKRLYFASERLYCIYYKLRRERNQAGVVRLLLQFMTAFYAPREFAGLLHGFWQEMESTSRFQPLIAEAVAESSRGEEALDYHRKVANDLMVEAQQHVWSGRLKKAVAVYNEVTKRFGDSSRTKLRQFVAAALTDMANCRVRLGEPERALSIWDEVVTRFGSSSAPKLKQMVVIALLNKGTTLRSDLNDFPAALAAFESVIARSDADDDQKLMVLVANAMVGKASAHQALGQHVEAKAAFDEMLAMYASWDLHVCEPEVAMHNGAVCGQLGETASVPRSVDAPVHRNGAGDNELYQEQVALALLGKGIACGLLGEAASAMSSYDEIAARFGTSENPRLWKFAAKALLNKGREQLKSSRHADAIETCDNLKASFGDVPDPNGIPFGWQADWTRAMALTALGRTASVMDALRSLASGFIPESPPMVEAMLTHVPELIAQGVHPGDMAQVMSRDPRKASALLPLVVALRQLVGETVRAPAEVMEVAADILELMGSRDQAAEDVT
ncbi:MAG: hypothetical protein F4Y08_11480 [Caldilineaceae bacterium SB0662_bin_9]|uniref:AAA family ATPase n=1 Tax=Caldilineaceae bacterium SB0662_bin_9 TaxID=2605258 RepID=A0A6B1DVW9_9CHLR|nr:ATP-binding protein [Caldilineaceae bacterium]MYD90935.1 hypothetical protein [Caldilineaceae bacterium SB0662_bin_9]